MSSLPIDIVESEVVDAYRTGITVGVDQTIETIRLSNLLDDETLDTLKETFYSKVLPYIEARHIIFLSERSLMREQDGNPPSFSPGELS